MRKFGVGMLCRACFPVVDRETRDDCGEINVFVAVCVEDTARVLPTLLIGKKACCCRVSLCYGMLLIVRSGQEVMEVRGRYHTFREGQRGRWA